MKKNILFMLTSMNIGGVEKSLLSLLSVIPKEKYDITLLLLEKKGELLKYIPEWVKVEESTWFKEVKPIILQPPQRTIKNLFTKKKYLEIILFGTAYLLSKHFNNRFFFYQNALRKTPGLSDKYDIAISYQGPTDIIDYYIGHKVTAEKKISWIHFDISKHKVNQKLYERLYVKFNQILIVSEEARKSFLKMFPKTTGKTDVFNNIVQKDLITQMSKTSAEHEMDFKGTKIVTVGRLSREKGQDLGIKILYRLRSEGYNVKWYCVGEGTQRKEYEKLIQEHNLENDFILTGSTPNPYPYIQKADIYVQTSLHEGYCLTLSEAKCLKKPIVTTNFIGAFEQITNGYNGWIVETNEESLYERIKFLMDNPTERERLSRNLSHYEVDSTFHIDELILDDLKQA